MLFEIFNCVSDYSSQYKVDKDSGDGDADEEKVIYGIKFPVEPAAEESKSNQRDGDRKADLTEKTQGKQQTLFHNKPHLTSP